MWCSLLLPLLPLDVFARGWPAEAHARPFVVASGGHHPDVVAVNAGARKAGIRAGMSILAALALAPEVVLRDRDLTAEQVALEQIATFALTYTPSVVCLPPGAVLAEIGGSLRLFGGADKLVGRLEHGVRERGFSVRLGLAPTPIAALALARAGGDLVRDGDGLPATLASLPLALFDIDPAVLATLKAAGVTTFGEADALPRDGLARRFGPDLVALLDRALGRRADPRAPYLPPPQFTAKLELPAPVHDVEALVFAVNRLVLELASWLEARGLGVLRLSLTLQHERARMRDRDSPATRVSFALGAPARTPAHLLGVLRERLARLVLPAPVEAVALGNGETAPLVGRTLGLLPGDEAASPPVPLVDRLRARLGDEAVTRIETFAEHRPEWASRSLAQRLHKPRLAAAPLPDHPPRPVWLLATPRPLTGRIEQAPWVLRDGPERIESGWWDGTDIRRDYFVAETPDGASVWVFRDHRYGTADGEWFLHGLFA